MFKAPRTDLWTVGVVPERLDRLSPERLQALRDRVIWLPEAGPWRYYADPFALRRGDTLHVFVEAFDYRTRPGHLERLDLHLPSLQWSAARCVLRQPFHLSYPQVFDWDGATWMVPESRQANQIALYQADATLDTWTRVAVLLDDVPAVDASLIFHDGLWWMFYALVGAKHRDRNELHAAFAPQLQGPWTMHPGNPVFTDRLRARPGGTPYVDADGRVVLPIQDCSTSYGGAARRLAFDRLTPTEVRTHAVPGSYTGDLVSNMHCDGLHTLSACGEFTLLDVKRIDRSRARQWLDWQRRLRRLLPRTFIPGNPQ